MGIVNAWAVAYLVQRLTRARFHKISKYVHAFLFYDSLGNTTIKNKMEEIKTKVENFNLIPNSIIEGEQLY